MTFQEYPKALYRNGEYTAVVDANEEAEMRKDGWTDWYSDQQKMQNAEAKAESNPAKKG